MKNRNTSKLKYINKPLLIVTIIFAVLGAFLILDASSISSVLRYGNDSPYHFFKLQLFFVAVGLVAMFVVSSITTKSYKLFAPVLCFAGLGALCFVFLYNKTFNPDSINVVTMTLAGITFQPAEFLKIFILMYMGVYYEKWINSPNRVLWKMYIPLAFAVFAFLLIAIGGDLGSAILMGTLFAITFISLPIKERENERKWYSFNTIKLVAIIGLILGLSFLKFGYKIFDEETLLNSPKWIRLLYKDPCDRYESSTGYQACNGYIAIDNGGLFGVGIGNSVQKYLYLPESHTDYIFPIVIEEFGSLVGIAILLLYIYLLYLILKVASNTYRLQNSIICYGIATYISLHIFVNLGGVFGLIPVTGVPLPFLSYGGSSCIVLLASLGIVQRINIENQIYRMKKLSK